MMALEHMPSVAGFDAEVRDLVTDLAERVRIRERDRILALLDSEAVKEGAKSAAKSESLDRFASEHLADDAREWLAGFASRAALAEVKRQIGGDLA